MEGVKEKVRLLHLVQSEKETAMRFAFIISRRWI